jgi:hypothetical protein
LHEADQCPLCGAERTLCEVIATSECLTHNGKAEPAWQAAQVQAKDLLGKAGAIAVVDIANRIMGPTA